MTRFILPWLVIVLIPFGCDKADSDRDDHTHADGDDHDHADGDDKDHDHTDGDGHEGEDGHEDEDGHGHGGEHHELGLAKVLDVELKVVQIGEIEKGSEALFDVTLAQGTKPSAIRLWIGQESGEGSMKSKASEEDAGYHVHLNVPRALDDSSLLWVEIETEDGKKSAASMAYHK